MGWRPQRPRLSAPLQGTPTAMQRLPAGAVAGKPGRTCAKRVRLMPFFTAHRVRTIESAESESVRPEQGSQNLPPFAIDGYRFLVFLVRSAARSEEHTSELQS